MDNFLVIFDIFSLFGETIFLMRINFQGFYTVTADWIESIGSWNCWM